MPCDLKNKMNFLARLITRPPRSKYEKKSEKEVVLYKDKSHGMRFSVSFKNNRDQTIIGSFYQAPSPAPGNPCVIYLHGNASSQNEGAYIPFLLCPQGVNVLCIDLSGSGNSDGEYITLGYNERDDVQASIDFLRQTYKVGSICLWGRSMGASIAAWCASDNFDVAAVVIDSAYLSVDDIIRDIVGNSWFLWGLSKLLVPLVNITVKKMIGVSIYDINLINSLKKARVPALIIHASHDSFINIREAREMFARYGGREKYMLTTRGDHNSKRPRQVQMAILTFILNNFDIQPDIVLDEVDDHSNAHYQNAFDMMKNM